MRSELRPTCSRARKKPEEQETMESKHIIQSKQTSEVIEGNLTEVVCTAFGDHIFVMVTQFGKMGTLISLTPTLVENEFGKALFSTKILMGKEEPLMHVYAKHLVTFVSEESGNKSVLLALALKDPTLSSVKSMKQLIQSCRLW
ncbi:proteasome assembly chaperone 3 isoform X1 [Callorhinchus milii]|nr:proteasome assembly chaperone 3 isoform X1 [Callorhinchus milii]